MSERKKTTRKFKAEVSRVLSLVVNSLYSNKEIFLRELISNSSDALAKLRVLALQDKGIYGDDSDLAIHLAIDPEARTVTITDNGIGMTKEELIENLGTVAHSGTLKFLEQAESTGDARLIGQFGVGFYSSFLVADRVEVTSRAAGSDEAWTWTSDAKESFTVAPSDKADRGTAIVLHIKEEQQEYLEPWRLRNLVTHYSDFVSHPIFLAQDPAAAMAPPSDEGEDAAPPEPKQINSGTALWQRAAADISDEEYNEFYKHLSHDWEEPLARTHFKIEGTQLFSGLLYLPRQRPFDLFQREHRRGVRLFVNRVFIMDDAEELVPIWLRFVRGVIDSDDLPLNVSREILQDSGIAKVIRNQIIGKSLDAMKALAEDRPEDFETFWSNFGEVLKEGLHAEPKHRNRIGELIRYRSSAGDAMTTLDGYVERMPEGQEVIYYVIADSETAAAGSPHTEALKAKGYEVLYMTDPIDEWAVNALGQWQEKELVSAMQADLDLDESEEEAKAREEASEGLAGLTERFQSVLDEHISEVRLSNRLTDSPCCLVVPPGGQHAYMERVLRASGQDVPKMKRILELNPNHPLIQNLNSLQDMAPERAELTEWIETLYDQVLLTEGSPINDPGRFAQRMTALLLGASKAAVDTPAP